LAAERAALGFDSKSNPILKGLNPRAAQDDPTCNTRAPGESGGGPRRPKREAFADGSPTLRFHAGNWRSKSLWLPIQIQTHTSLSNLWATAR
jgi:hypothetical protein